MKRSLNFKGKDKKEIFATTKEYSYEIIQLMFDNLITKNELPSIEKQRSEIKIKDKKNEKKIKDKKNEIKI